MDRQDLPAHQLFSACGSHSVDWRNSKRSIFLVCFGGKSFCSFFTPSEHPNRGQIWPAFRLIFSDADAISTRIPLKLYTTTRPEFLNSTTFGIYTFSNRWWRTMLPSIVRNASTRQDPNLSVATFPNKLHHAACRLLMAR